MTKSDQDFIDAFEGSKSAVEKVLAWAKGKNLDVAIKESRLRPDFDHRVEYADEGDLEIRKRIEVKHRKLKFTSAEDYPFSTVFVDEAYKVDRYPIETLSSYVIVNKPMTHAAIVLAGTREHWFIERRYDPTNGDMRNFYVCPVRFTKFISLEENQWGS